MGEDAVHIFDAIDSYGAYHTDARVEDGRIVDGNGAVIEGAFIDEDGTVYDAVMNPVSTVETEAPLDPKVDNPDMAVPPAENEGAADNTALWDATATDEGTPEQ